LHIEEIYSYFDSISLAYLVNWLDIRPIDELRYLQVVELKRVLELLELLLLLLLVLVHPQDSACTSGLDIGLVVGAILRHAVLLILIHRNASLLAIC
jgi:hypothetical protein